MEGEAGWIAMRATDEHLRPLASPDVCQRWLAQLRAPCEWKWHGSLPTRRSVLEISVQFGTSEQQVAALAALYDESSRPDVEDVTLIDNLERIVVIEIACVLGRDPDELRAALHQRPRLQPDAIPSGKVTQPTRPNDLLAVFEVGRELLVTDLDTSSVRLPAVRGTWRAFFATESTWIAIAEGYRDRLPLTGRCARGRSERRTRVSVRRARWRRSARSDARTSAERRFDVRCARARRRGLQS